jgi:hypothetical protein
MELQVQHNVDMAIIWIRMIILNLSALQKFHNSGAIAIGVVTINASSSGFQ